MESHTIGMHYKSQLPTIFQHYSKTTHPKQKSQTRPGADSLQNLFKSYELPAIQPNFMQFAPPGIDDESREEIERSVGYTKSALSSTQSVHILHNKLVYPNVDVSKQLLQRNKSVYENMQSMLATMEVNKYRVALKRAKLRKRKLDYFGSRVRLSDFADNKSIF